MNKLAYILAVSFLTMAVACGATDEQALAPEISTTTEALSPPDGSFEGNNFTAQSCKVSLVYCADPRYTPHYPSFCQNGCNKDAAFAAAIKICKNVCGSINCNTMYVLGGC